MFFKNGKRGTVSYDYSSSYAREDTVLALLTGARNARAEIEEYWRKMRSYYDGTHGTSLFTDGFAAENSLPFRCAQSADGYIHVESQIDAQLPDFEFSPVGEDDSDKAKQRERLVRGICDRNDMEYKNSRNERRLGILGSAVWKVCWDETVRLDGSFGDIVIDNPRPWEIYPDPCAGSVDDCEYIGYVYSMHREKARRIFARELRRKGIDFDELIHRSGHGKSGALADFGESDNGDTVRITEWWFRHPSDGEADIEYTDVDGKVARIRCTYKSGDIGLCILLGDTEVRYVPKYWSTTDCRMFPFVIYDKLPNENTIWGKSELEAIIPFIDAADREIAYAQLNSAFTSNDIIVAEENAFSDDCEPDNSPGAIWKLRPGMMGKVQRLGSGAYSEGYLHANYDKWRALMQETTGNFTVNQGNEPERVTTATGIALLNERAKNRNALKKIDKSAGFRRLYELCDRTALEYYDDGRVILCGAAGDESVVYRASDYRRGSGKDSYIPSVDVKIHIGDGLANSKAFSISTVGALMSANINRDNYRIVKSYLELIDIPARKEICDALDERFGSENGGEEMLSQVISEIYNDKDGDALTDTEVHNG
ncbi:MAG: hypothetical protein IKU43_00325 [Clostridia bacterium]|nr:hypothetical protein [Clostridia bacterium]